MAADNTPDEASSGSADRPQDPRVQRLRPDPRQPPQPALTLTGFLGDSDRPGYRRLYFTRSLDSYAEFKTEDVLHTAGVAADEHPFPGEEASRVSLRRDATVEYTRTRTARPLDEFDLDIRLGGRPARPAKLPDQITEETCGGDTCACGDTDTCWFTCPGCGLTSETCDGCGTDITCASCGDTCAGATCRGRTCFDTCLRTDCNQATCDTCQTQCDTCVTCNTCQTQCGQATCATCAGQATCATCAGQATCVTCDTCAGQATCQTCMTDCRGRTCVTCDTCNPHIPTCGRC